MEDINALNNRLQAISKTLEDFQATTLLQEEKIRQCTKQRAENDDLAKKIRENLASVDREVASEQNILHDLKTTTIHLQTEFNSTQFRLSHVPMVIGKVCIDYERNSTKLRRKIEALSSSLKTNDFWVTQTRKAHKETEYFRGILTETQQSRREFSSSEEIRLRNELEIEESRLSYLQACIADTAQTTVSFLPSARDFHSDRHPHSPSQRANHVTRNSTPNTVTPPREHSHSEASFQSSSEQEQHHHDTGERETHHSLKRQSLFPSYHSIYPRRHSAEDLPVQDEEGSYCYHSEDSQDNSVHTYSARRTPWEDDHNHTTDVATAGSIELTVSSSTTTVTKRTVMWTEPDSSYSTDNTVNQTTHPSSWPVAPPYITDSNNNVSDRFAPSRGSLNTPSLSMRVPEVPWFREFKRRRVSAAFGGSSASATDTSTTTIETVSAFPVEHEDRQAHQAQQQHTIAGGLQHQQSVVVHKNSTNSALLGDMDLYDTSGSEEEDGTQSSRIPSKQQSGTELSDGTGANQVTSMDVGGVTEDWSGWSEESPSHDIIHHTGNRTSEFPKKSTLAGRFHTGLALIRSSKDY